MFMLRSTRFWTWPETETGFCGADEVMGLHLGKKCPPMVRFIKRGVGGSVSCSISLFAECVKILGDWSEF